MLKTLTLNRNSHMNFLFLLCHSNAMPGNEKASTRQNSTQKSSFDFLFLHEWRFVNSVQVEFLVRFKKVCEASFNDCPHISTVVLYPLVITLQLGTSPFKTKLSFSFWFAREVFWNTTITRTYFSNAHVKNIIHCGQCLFCWASHLPPDFHITLYSFI